MNDGDQALTFLYLIGMLVLVLSGFGIRRLAVGQSLKMVAAWVLIFAVVFIGFTLKDDFMALGRRIVADSRSQDVAVQQGETMRIRQSADGHFWVAAELNGAPVRFLIDSGATTTSISVATARRAGIEPQRGLPAVVQTANGVVRVQRGRAERIEVGTIERDDLAVHISASFGETNVLGMNFLSSLSGWGVEQSTLVLRP